MSEQVETSHSHMELHKDGIDMVKDVDKLHAVAHEEGEGFLRHQEHAVEELHQITKTTKKVIVNGADEVIAKITKEETPEVKDRSAKIEQKKDVNIKEESKPDDENALRYGTILLMKAAEPKKEVPFAPTPESIQALMPRIPNLVFSLMAVNSFFSQITIAFKWIKLAPLVTLFLLFKELFGVILCGQSLVQALLQRPTPRVFDDAVDPFNPRTGLLKNLKLEKSLQYTVQKFVYGLSCLSNLRNALSLLVAFRWGLSLPVMALETELQKVGNLIFLSIDLIVKVKGEDKNVNSWLFISLLMNGFLVCLSQINHFALMNNTNDFLKDIDEGKLDKEQIAKGMAGYYSYSFGEQAQEHFAANCYGSKVQAYKQKAE